MRAGLALWIVVVALGAAAPVAGAWGTPPPGCTAEGLGVPLDQATPYIVGLRDRDRILISEDSTVVELGGTVDPDLAFSDPFVEPDTLLLELRRKGGKVIRTYSGQGALEPAEGEFTYPRVERDYQVGVLAIYNEFTEAPCSLTSEITFSTFRRQISPAAVRARLGRIFKRMQRRLDGVSSAAGLRAAANGLDRDLGTLVSVRVRTDEGTKALDSFVVYGRRFASYIVGVADRADRFIVPGASDLRTIETRGRELVRSAKRLRRALEKSR